MFIPEHHNHKIINLFSQPWCHQQILKCRDLESAEIVSEYISKIFKIRNYLSLLFFTLCPDMFCLRLLETSTWYISNNLRFCSFVFGYFISLRFCHFSLYSCHIIFYDRAIKFLLCWKVLEIQHLYGFVVYDHIIYE